MILDMIFRLVFTIGSFFITVLLYIAYFSKRFKLKLQNKIYIYLLMNCVLVLVSEFLSCIYFAIGDNQLIYDIFVKVQCSTVIIWGVLLLSYCYALITKVEYDNYLELILNNNLIKLFTGLSTIIIGAFIFLPVPALSDKVINFMPGICSYICVIQYIVSILLIAIVLAKNLDKVLLKDRIIIILILLEVPILAVVQNIFPSCAFLGLACSLQMLFIYFYYENPDLFMIEEIEKLTAETEKMSRIKAEFLSNMSHEIRSPMNAIMGFSESILNDANFDKERVLNDINIIESSSKNLLEIINNILDISKIESNQDTLEEKDYSFNKIIQDLTAITQSRIGTKPIKLIFDIEEGIPDKLHGDSTKIFQVLLNIMTNAVKYTEVGRINVTINKEIQGDKILLMIKVADTGYGIKKEDYDKMFEKFSRLSEATTNEIEGTGLGLVITKRYVDLMQGKIWFESEYGVGTTFFVDIPQVILKNQNIEIEEDKDESKEEVVPKSVDFSRYKVLIVDDNKLNIKVAQRLLMNYNLQVETCMSGKDCIYRFKEGTHYDMIFMDHMMPEMDGIECFHILRKLDGYYQPPIVALTANAVSGAKEMYLEEGFDEYLSKPINTKELEDILNKYFH